MAVTFDMNLMIQANMSYRSARTVNSTREHMEGEKQQIHTEIELDGHSSKAKDQRLDQISSQSVKADSLIADAVNTSKEKTQKAGTEQQKDSTSSVDKQEADGKTDDDSKSGAAVSSESVAKAVNAGSAQKQPVLDLIV